MLQFWYSDGSDRKKDKEELIKVEAMPIHFSNRSDDEDVARVYFVII